MEVFYAALASLGFGVFFNLRGRKLFAAAAGGGIVDEIQDMKKALAEVAK